MRLRLALALAALPLAVASYLIACNPPAELENLCGWIGDENNCYRQFATDVSDRCGAFVSAATPPNDPNQASPRHGSFLKRDKLDLCIFDSAAGGQVIFDPPLDLADFPVTKTAFAIKNGDGTLCGAGAVGLDGAFAINIEAFPAIPDAGGGGAAPDCSSASQICGGTFSVSSVTERELADTKCPSGETHHFNRLQLAKCDGDQAIEEDLDQLMPRAELLSDPGTVGNNGYIRFRVVYPPALTGVEDNLNGQQPVVVEYFECAIPGANPTCANGLKDDAEPDVDCGAVCGVGCADTKPCYINADCASRHCEAVLGKLTCTPNPDCSNMKLDPGEGAQDCGYFCTTKCADCQTCNINADCASNVCIDDGTGKKKCRMDADAGACGSSSSSSSGGAGGAGGSSSSSSSSG